MNEAQFHQHGGPDAASRPRWKRIHHSPFFWIAACFILLAMIVYVVTGDLSFGRAEHRKARCRLLLRDAERGNHGWNAVMICPIAQ